ncbi:MAG: hypothetical protein K0S71_370 [Clostridia bacterium]|jgi:hypothetical protein|nr:hypothetical protein [Clostridia bacterium]
MKDMKKNILCMQENLNRILGTTGFSRYNTKPIYTLSLKLDKEIVKYYRNLNNN